MLTGLHDRKIHSLCQDCRLSLIVMCMYYFSLVPKSIGNWDWGWNTCIHVVLFLNDLINHTPDSFQVSFFFRSTCFNLIGSDNLWSFYVIIHSPEPRYGSLGLCLLWLIYLKLALMKFNNRPILHYHYWAMYPHMRDMA